MTGLLSREAALGVIVSLIADELTALRGRAVPVSVWSSWNDQTSVDEDGIGVDSLDRLNLVARVNEFFRLHAVGTEDYLVVQRSLGDWADIVLQTLGMGVLDLTFRTSGSTGEPKKIELPIARLEREIAGLSRVLAGAGRVIALVPPHHIYGFLFTALLPTSLGAARIEGRLLGPSSVRERAGEGALIVATPHLFEHLAAAPGAGFDGAWGVTSTAPAPAGLWPRLHDQGLARLVEIYGSSETSGIGWRESPDAAFTLMAHWTRSDDGLIDADGAVVVPPDELAWDDARSVRPVKRRDGAVQVGGINVFPDRVRSVLLEHEGVEDCAVRLDPQTGRLKAFVATGASLDAESLAAHCAERLSTPERPARYTFGAALPRTDMGKLADWA